MAGWPPEKNATFTWFFVLRDADGDLVAGATALDVEFSIDGGAFVNVAGAEVDEGEGLYSCPITAAEMNGDVISLICKTSTGGVKTAAVVIYTSTRQIDDLAFPATTGRSIQVETDGMVHADIKEWLSIVPLALVSQRVQSQVGAMATNVITAAAFNAAAITAAKFGVGAIDASAIAMDAIGSSELAASAVQEIVDGILDELSASHVGAGTVGQILDNLPNDGALTTIQSDISNIQTRLPTLLVNARMDSELQAVGFVQAAADKIWLSPSRTLTAISTAVALSIWDVLETAILTANSIGLKVKTNLDALISSRSSHSASDVTTDMDANSVDFNSLLTLITAARMGALDDWIDGGRLDVLLDLIKAKTDALPSGPAKNVALSTFEFLMVLSSDDVTPGTGLTVTGEVSIDGAAFTGLTNAITEVANGFYKVDFTAAELNGDVIGFKFTAALANQTSIVFLTT